MYNNLAQLLFCRGNSGENVEGGWGVGFLLFPSSRYPCSEQILLICWIIQRCLEAVSCERTVIIWTLTASAVSKKRGVAFTTGWCSWAILDCSIQPLHVSAWLKPLHSSPFSLAAQGAAQLRLIGVYWVTQAVEKGQRLGLDFPTF